MTGFLDIDLIGDATSVHRMLSYLEVMLGPIGMAGFLELNVGPYLQSRARDRFQTEGDDVSGTWQALAASTVQRRERMGLPGANPINRRTTELERYITRSGYKTTPNPVGVTLQYPAEKGRGFGLQQKMQTAQMGKTYPATPARPVLGMNERDLLYVVSTLAFYIQKGGGTV